MKNSIELLLTLFPAEFTKEKINEYVTELKSLKYEKEDKNLSRKEQLLGYMRQILSVVEKR
jgi:hypothetical protein